MAFKFVNYYMHHVLYVRHTFDFTDTIRKT